MKKKWIVALLMGAMLVTFAGCSSDEGSDVSGETSMAISADEETTEKTEQETTENETLQLGATYSMSDVEITFNNIYMSDSCTVAFDATSGIVVEATEGNTLIVVDTLIKNLGKEAMNLYSDAPFKVKVEYDNNYEYEDEGNFVGESDIAPLATKPECLTVEVPDEVANGTEPLVVYVSVGSATYTYNIR